MIPSRDCAQHDLGALAMPPFPPPCFWNVGCDLLPAGKAALACRQAVPVPSGAKARKSPLLSVPNVLGRALAIERQDLELPLQRQGIWQEARFAIACLIVERSGNPKNPSIGPKRIAEVRRGAYLYILPDTERPFEYGNALIYGRQEQNLGRRVNLRPELQVRSRINDQFNRLVAFRTLCINMDIARQPHFSDQGDQTSGHARRVRLLNTDLQMGSLDGINYFFIQLGKQLCDDVIARQPLPVLGLEKLLTNDALRVEEKISGPGHTLELANSFRV